MPAQPTLRNLIALPLSALLLSTGCTALSSGGGGTGEGEGGGKGTTLSFANSYTTEHPHTRCGIQRVADDINGQKIGLTIKTFPNSQLGADTERFTSVMEGDVDMDVQGASALSATFGPIGVLDMAYAFDGPDHLFSFFDGERADALKEDFAKKTGTRILDVWYFGMRHFSAKKAIRTPADLKGLRMRFPDSPIYLENAKALGAKATAVAFEEVYTALQQGIIDGQENPIPTIAEMSFDEVQSHVSLSGHQTGSQLIVINEERWRSLSKEQQEALQKSVSATRAADRKCVEDDEQKILKEWADKGTVSVIRDVDRETFAANAQKYLRENLSGEQLELYQTVRQAAGE